MTDSFASAPMNPPAFGPAPPVRTYPPPANHQIQLRQQADRAKVVVRGREKDRKPVDPPPVVQLRVNDPYNDICSFLHNPYYFCTVMLWEADADRQQLNPDKSNTRLKDDELLIGTLVSSLHRLKDLDNSEQGFFVFGDLSVAILGRFRLRFLLWEIHPETQDAHCLRDVVSSPFEVTAAKDWDGVRESTPLSRALADQGVRLRLRKESRHSGKRGYSTSGGSSLAPQTPIRPGPTHGYDGMEGPPQGYVGPNSNGWGQPQSMYSAIASQQHASYPGYPPPGGSYQYGSPYYAQQQPYGTPYAYPPQQRGGDPRSYSQGYGSQPMSAGASHQQHYEYPGGQQGGSRSRPDSGYYENTSYGRYPAQPYPPQAQHQSQQQMPQPAPGQYGSRDMGSPTRDARLAPIRREDGSDYSTPTQQSSIDHN